MINSKVILSGILAVFIGGCASNQSEVEFKPVEHFKDENASYEIDTLWYKKYGESYLNKLVDQALANNYDLKTAALNVESAYANLGLSRADLFPTLSSSWSAGANRDISTGSNWNKTYSSGFNVSYELDLFGKIRSAVNAEGWNAKASEFDLENTRLTLINSVVSGYFEMLYLNDSLKWTKQNLSDYREIEKIIKAKYDYGKSEQLDYRQIQNSILGLENKVLSIQKNIEDNHKYMRNLISSSLQFDDNTDSINSIEFQGVDLNVPYTALANRPDIRAAIARLNSSFYDEQTAKLNFFPSVNLGAGLTNGQGVSANDSFKLNFLSGNVSISLPFLDYARVENRLKISEIAFRKNVVNYEQTLSNATNEVLNLYRIYQINLASLKNLSVAYDEKARIADLYAAKYEAGSSELKDMLEARTDAVNAKINELNQRYLTLQNEAAIYRAMAGKFKRK